MKKHRGVKMFSIMKEIWAGLKNDLCLRVILFLFAGITLFLFMAIGIFLLSLKL